MNEAAPSAASSDVEQALGYLRLLWGDEFLIGHDELGYWAAPHGQIGHIIRADVADELGEKLNGMPGTLGTPRSRWTVPTSGRQTACPPP